MARSKQLLSEFDLDTHPRVCIPFVLYNIRLEWLTYVAQTKFTTRDDEHVGDDYFLTSGDKIRYFFEEEAVEKDGQLNRPKEKSVNKIGHGEHTTVPV